MSDIPLEKAPLKDQKEHELTITQENAAIYTAIYTIQIYKRLGYLIKLLEKK